MQGKFENRRFSKYKIFLAIPRQLAARQLIIQRGAIFRRFLFTMVYNPLIYGRHSIRLTGFDYSQNGYYFITICTYEREYLFGKISDNKMALNQLGEIIKEEWLNTEKIRKNVKIGKFKIMPNHIHGIIIINNNGIETADCRGVLQQNNNGDDGRGVLQYAPTSDQINKFDPLLYASIDDFTNKQVKFKSPSQTIGSIIRGFKSAAAKKINLLLKSPGQPVWQRNYL